MSATGERPRRLTLARRLLFALLPLALLLLSGEGLLRLLGPPPVPSDPGLGFSAGGARADPDFGWRLVPGGDVRDPVREAWERHWGLGDGRTEAGDGIDAYGFRDAPLAFPKPEGQRRLLVLGDSSVYGSGVPVSARFTEVLERALDPVHGADPQRRAVELVNGGVPGWSSYQSLLQLHESLDLGIDGVVVYSVNSDMMSTEGGYPDYRYFPARARLRGATAVQRLYLLQWLRWSLSDVARPRPTQVETRRVPVDHYRDNLERIVALCRAHGMGLVMVVAPTALDLVEERSAAAVQSEEEAAAARAWLAEQAARPSLSQGKPAYQKAMGLVAWEAGVPLVDGPRLFSRAVRAEPRRRSGADALFVDEVHPSVAGHALLAQALEPVLRALLPTLPDRPATRPPPTRAERVEAARMEAARAEQAAPPAVRQPAAPPDPGATATLELRCSARTTADAQHALLHGEIRDAPPGATQVRLHLLRPGLHAADEVGTALCPTGPYALAVPRDLGEVRVVAMVDADADGPCRNDPAAAGAVVDVSAGDQPLDLALAPPGQAGAWGPPYGLAYGLLPLLPALVEHGVEGRVAVVLAEGLQAGARIGEGLPLVERNLREAGRAVRLRRGAPDEATSPDLAAVVVVEPLGGGLLAQAQAARPALSPVASWTDPTGASWALLVAASGDAPTTE